MRWDSSSGVAPPMSMAPRARRLTVSGPSEVYTWSQLGIHDKPCGVLNVRGYYDPLAAFLDHAVAEGFLRPQHRAVLSVADEPAELLDRLAPHEPPTVGKWLELEESWPSR